MSIDLRGKRVLVMGLGLQGSGMAAARYAALQGAQVRVTDMKSPEVLAPSVQALTGLPIEFILGQHREEDFRWAEIVIRNPGVPWSSPYLQIARSMVRRLKWRLRSSSWPAPVVSLVLQALAAKLLLTSLLYEILRSTGQHTILGGNVAGVETLSLLSANPR